MKRNLALLILSTFIFFTACAPDQQPESEASAAHLGDVQFEVTGAPKARAHFREGLLLLHSFEYSDARAAFKKAQEADPDMAMAHWGEAMTYNHSLWRNQKTEQAQEALRALGETAEERLAKAGSELERDFLQAAEYLFFSEDEKFERDQAYSEWLGQLYEKYPGNHEVAAFYALSLLGAVPVGRDEEAYGNSARVAQGIIEENPNHPGALHYLIHSYDDPGHAHLAKLAADSYSEVAPDAAHALHMPSHIYVALGMWDEVVASNIASYEASVKRMQRMELDNDGRSYHAFAWLLYGYLQQGQFGRAQAIMEDMVRYAEEKPSGGARSYLIEMKGSYLIQTGRWNEELAEVEVDLSGLNIVNRANYAYLQGHKAYVRQQTDSLKTIIGDLAEDIRGASNLVTDAGVPMCSSASPSRALPNRLDIDQSKVMEMELRALLADLQGDTEKAEKWFREATELEYNASYAYGPPVIMYPSFELYGAWLLRQDRAEEAMQQFNRALERGPKRALALQGKLRAAEMIEDEQAASEVREMIDEIRKEIRREDQLSLR